MARVIDRPVRFITKNADRSWVRDAVRAQGWFFPRHTSVERVLGQLPKVVLNRIAKTLVR